MKTSTKVIQWTPRILCILAILFVSLFALDSFSSDRTFIQNVLALLMHLLPSIVLLAVLILAWKWERAGGIVLTILGVVWLVAVFHLNYTVRQFSLIQSLINVSLLCLPFILSGILFIMSYYRKKKENTAV
jgi:hypothetical protein